MTYEELQQTLIYVGYLYWFTVDLGGGEEIHAWVHPLRVPLGIQVSTTRDLSKHYAHIVDVELTEGDA